MIENKNQLYQEYLSSDETFQTSFPTFEAFDQYVKDESTVAKLDKSYHRKPQTEISMESEGQKKKDGERSGFRSRFPWNKVPAKNAPVLPKETELERLKRLYPNFDFAPKQVSDASDPNRGVPGGVPSVDPGTYGTLETNDPTEALLRFTDIQDLLDREKTTYSWNELPSVLLTGTANTPTYAINGIQQALEVLYGLTGNSVVHERMPELVTRQQMMQVTDQQLQYDKLTVEALEKKLRSAEPEALKAAMGFFMMEDQPYTFDDGTVINPLSPMIQIERDAKLAKFREEDARRVAEGGTPLSDAERLNIEEKLGIHVNQNVYDDDLPILLKQNVKPFFDQFLIERPADIGAGFMVDHEKVDKYAMEVYKKQFLTEPGVKAYYDNKFPGWDDPVTGFSLESYIESEPSFKQFKYALTDAVNDANRANALENELDILVTEKFPNDERIQRMGFRALPEGTSNILKSFVANVEKEKVIQLKSEIQNITAPYVQLVEQKNKKAQNLLEIIQNKYGISPEGGPMTNPYNLTEEEYLGDIQKFNDFIEQSTEGLAEASKAYEESLKLLQINFTADYKEELEKGMEYLDFGDYGSEEMTALIYQAMENVRVKTQDLDNEYAQYNSLWDNLWNQFYLGSKDMFRGISAMTSLYFGGSNMVSNYFEELADNYEKYNTTFMPKVMDTPEGFSWLEGAILSAARQGQSYVPMVLSLTPGVGKLIPTWLGATTGMVTDTAMEAGSLYNEILESTGSRVKSLKGAQKQGVNNLENIWSYFAEFAAFKPKAFGKITDLKGAFVNLTYRVASGAASEAVEEYKQEAMGAGVIQAEVFGKSEAEIRALGTDILGLSVLSDEELRRQQGEDIPVHTLHEAAVIAARDIAAEVAFPTSSMAVVSTSVSTYRQLRDEKITKRALSFFDNLGYTNYIQNSLRDLGLNGTLHMGALLKLQGVINNAQFNDFVTAAKRINEYSNVANQQVADDEVAQHAIVGLTQQKYELGLNLENVETEEAKQQIKEQMAALQTEIDTIKENKKVTGYAVVKHKGKIVAVLKNEKMAELIKKNKGDSALMEALGSGSIEIESEDQNLSKLKNDASKFAYWYKNVLSPLRFETSKKILKLRAENKAKQQKGENALSEEQLKEAETKLLEEGNNKLKDDLVAMQSNTYVDAMQTTFNDLTNVETLDDVIDLTADDSTALDAAMADPNLSQEHKSLLRQAQEVARLLGLLHPNAKVRLFKNAGTFNRNGGILGSDGTFDPNTNNILIDLSSATPFTIWHEVTHAALIKAFGDNPDLFVKFKSQMLDALDDKTKMELEQFISSYNEEYVKQTEGRDLSPESLAVRVEQTKAEEFLAQLGAFMRVKKTKLNVGTMQKIKRAIIDVLNALASKDNSVGKFISRNFADRISAFYDNEKLMDFFTRLGEAHTEKGAVEFSNLASNLADSRVNADIKIEDLEQGNIAPGTPVISTRASRRSAVQQFFNRTNVKLNPNAARYSKKLDVKSLKKVIEQHEGAVMLLTSDTSGFGFNENGEWRWGGLGYMSVTDNVNDGIGFSSTEERVVTSIMNIAEASNNGNPVLALIMIQHPDAVFGNDWGTKYFADLMRAANQQNKKDALESVGSYIKNTAKIVTSLASKEETKILSDKNGVYTAEDKQNALEAIQKRANSIVEDINKIDLNDTQENVRNAFLNLFSNYTFAFRKNLIASTIAPDWKTRPNKSYPMRQFSFDNSMGKKAFHELYSEPQFTTQEQLENEDWGYVVGGFTIDPKDRNKVKGLKDKGVTHPFFDAKIPGKKPFLLDAVYQVNDNFNDALVPDPTSRAVTAAQMAAQSFFPSTRDYSLNSKSPNSKERRALLLDRANKNKYIKNKSWKASLPSFEFADQMFDLFVDNYGYTKTIITEEQQKVQKIKPIDRKVKVRGKQITIHEGQSYPRSMSYELVNNMMVGNWLDQSPDLYDKYMKLFYERHGYYSDPISMLSSMMWRITGGEVSTPNYQTFDIKDTSYELDAELGEQVFSEFSNFYLGREVERLGAIHRIGMLLYKKLNNETYADREYEVADATELANKRASYSALSAYDLAEMIRDNTSESVVRKLNKASMQRAHIQELVLVDLKAKFPEYTFVTPNDLQSVDPKRDVNEIGTNDFFVDDQNKYIVVPHTASVTEQLHFFAQFTLLNIQRFNAPLWAHLLKRAEKNPGLKSIYDELMVASKLDNPADAQAATKMPLRDMISAMADIMLGHMEGIFAENEMQEKSALAEEFIQAITNNVSARTETKYESMGQNLSLENLAWMMIDPTTSIGDFTPVKNPQNNVIYQRTAGTIERFKAANAFIKQGGGIEINTQRSYTEIKLIPNPTQLQEGIEKRKIIIDQKAEEIERFIELIGMPNDQLAIYIESLGYRTSNYIFPRSERYMDVADLPYDLQSLYWEEEAHGVITETWEFYDALTSVAKRISQDYFTALEDFLQQRQMDPNTEFSVVYNRVARYNSVENIDNLTKRYFPQVKNDVLPFIYSKIQEALEEAVNSHPADFDPNFAKLPQPAKFDGIASQALTKEQSDLQDELNGRLESVDNGRPTFYYHDINAQRKYITVNSVQEGIDKLNEVLTEIKEYIERNPRIGEQRASELEINIPEYTTTDLFGNQVVSPAYTDTIYFDGSLRSRPIYQNRNNTVFETGIYMNFRSQRYGYNITPNEESQARMFTPKKTAAWLMNQFSNENITHFEFTPAEGLRQSQQVKYGNDPGEFRRNMYKQAGARFQGNFYDEAKEDLNKIPINPVFLNRIIFPELYDTVPGESRTKGLKAEPGKPFKASVSRGQRFSKYDEQIKEFVEKARENNIPDLETFSVLFKKYGFEQMRISSYGVDFLNAYDEFMFEEAKKGFQATIDSINKRQKGIRNFIDKYIGEISLMDLVNMLRNGVEFLEDDQLNLDSGEIMILVDPDQAIFTPERLAKGKMYKFYDHEIFKALYEFGVDSGTLASIFGSDMRQTIARAIDDSGLSTNFTEGLEEDARSMRIARSIQELRETSQMFEGFDPTAVVNAIVQMLSGSNIEAQAQAIIDRIQKNLEQTSEDGIYNTLESELASVLTESALKEDYMALSHLASVSGRILRLMRQLNENPELLFFKHAENRGLIIPPQLKEKILTAARRQKETRIELRKALNAWKRTPNDENYKQMIDAQNAYDKATEDFARIADNQALKTSFFSERFNRQVSPALLAPHIVFMSGVSVFEVIANKFSPLRVMLSWAADKFTPMNKIGDYTIKTQSGYNTYFAAIQAARLSWQKSWNGIKNAVLKGSVSSNPVMDNTPASVNVFKDVSNIMFVLKHVANQLAQGKFGKSYEQLSDVEVAELFEVPLVEVENMLKVADGKNYTIAAALWRATFFTSAEAMGRLMPLGLDQALVNFLEMHSMLEYIDFNKNDNYLGLTPNLLNLVNQKAQNNGSTETENMARFMQAVFSVGDLNNNPFEKSALRDALLGDNQFLGYLGGLKRKVRKGMESNYRNILYRKYGIGKLKDGEKIGTKLGATVRLGAYQTANLALGSAIPFSKVPSNIVWMLMERGNPVGLMGYVWATFSNMSRVYNGISQKYQQQLPSLEDFVGDITTITLDPSKLIGTDEVQPRKPESSMRPYSAKRAARSGNYAKAAQVEQDMMELYDARRKFTEAVGMFGSVTALYTANMFIVMSGAFSGDDDDRKFSGLFQEGGLQPNELNFTYLKEFMEWLPTTKYKASEIGKASDVFFAKRGWKPTDIKTSVINLGTIFSYSLGFAYKTRDLANRVEAQDFFAQMESELTMTNLVGGLTRTVFKMTPSANIVSELIKWGDTKMGVADYETKAADIIGNLLGTMGAPYAPSLLGRPLAISEGKVIQSAGIIENDKETTMLPHMLTIAYQKMSRNGLIWPGTLRSDFYKSKIGLFGEDLSIRKTLSEPGTGKAYFESMINFSAFRTEPLNPKNPEDDSYLLYHARNGRQDAVEQMGREIEKQEVVQEFVSQLTYMGSLYYRLGANADIVGKIMNRNVRNNFIITDAPDEEVTDKNLNVPIALPNDILRDEARILGDSRYGVAKAKTQDLEIVRNNILAKVQDDIMDDDEKQQIMNEIYTALDAINTEMNAVEAQYRNDFMQNRRDIIVKELVKRGVLVQNKNVDEIQKLIELGVPVDLFNPESETYRNTPNWTPTYTELGTLRPTVNGGTNRLQYAPQ